MIANSLKVLVLVLLMCIPLQWHKIEFWRLQRSRADCSRPKSAIVRQTIHRLWKPVFKSFELKMPQSCPFHLARDIFAPQELNKSIFRSTLWTCGFCGKSFHNHVSLDRHMSNRHEFEIKNEDTSVCLADYCDIFRCHTYLPRPEKKEKVYLDNAMIAKYNLSEYNKFYPDLGLELPSVKTTELIRAPSQSILQQLRILESFNSSFAKENDEAEDKVRARIKNQNEVTDNVHTYLHRRVDTRRRHRSAFGWTDSDLDFVPNDDDLGNNDLNCLPEDMTRLRTKCEALLDECTSSLMAQVDQEVFTKLRKSLHDSSCWFLHCDRVSQMPRFGRFQKTDNESSKRRLQLSTVVLFVAGLLVLLILTCYAVLFCF